MKSNIYTTVEYHSALKNKDNTGEHGTLCTKWNKQMIKRNTAWFHLYVNLKKIKAKFIVTKSKTVATRRWGLRFNWNKGK